MRLRVAEMFDLGTRRGREAAIGICGRLVTEGKMEYPEYSLVMDTICEFDTLAERDKELEALWDKFGDVPMNPDTEKMKEPFIHFPAGTDREDIWHWFDERHSKGVAYLLHCGNAERRELTDDALLKLCIEYQKRSDETDIREWFENMGDEDIKGSYGVTRDELSTLVPAMARMMRRYIDNSDDWTFHRDYAIDTVIDDYLKKKEGGSNDQN